MKRTLLTVAVGMMTIMTANSQVNNTENQVNNTGIQVNRDSTSIPQDTIDWDKYLDQVTIVAAKPLVKMEADKLSYDVANDIESKSSTVLDMLRKVPMVTVDGQDNITVNGSSAFKVYVDGKPSPMFSTNTSQILKMMPASVVEKIEVITNPGAKYDAEGAVGILNFKLAKLGGAGGTASVDGATGTVRAEAGNRGYGGGVSFSAKQGNLSLSGNVMTTYQKLKGINMVTENVSLTDGSHLLQDLGTSQRMHFNMANLNMAYDIDSMNTVSASVDVNNYKIKNRYSPEISRCGGIYGEGIGYTYDADMKMKSTSFDASADWQHFLTSDHEDFLTLSYMLSYSPSDDESSQIYDMSLGMPSLYNHNKPHSLEQTLQFDFTKTVALGQKLNVGAKYINRYNKSDAKYYSVADGTKTLLDEMTTDFRHTNNIGAAYAEYEAEFGIFGAKGGLRYEHTWQKIEYKKGAGTDYSSDYGNLVPSLSLSLRPGLTKNIGLTYNMRISRPGISYLNPYIDRSNPISIQYGNADLSVEKNHNIGLSFGSYSQRLMYNLRLQQSICNDRISQYSFYKDEILNTTFGNIVKERQSAASLFVNWLAFPKTRLMFNGELSYIDLRSSALDQHNNGWSHNIFLGVQQTLPWDLKLGINYITGSKRYNLQGWSSGFQIGMVSLAKSWLDDRLTLSARYVTGLHDNGKLILDTYSKGKDFENTQSINVPISQFGISISYTFGNTKVRAKEHKSRIENDFSEKKSEQEQIGNAGSASATGL